MLGRAIAREAALRGGALGPRQRLGRRASLPVPVKGWNTRDALSEMTPHYAIKLENMFPDRGRIQLQRGYSRHATGLGTGAVETLFALDSGATRKLFGFAGSTVHDVTGAGAVGAALKTGLDGARWRGVNVGGHGILVSSGADHPLAIDGAGSFVARGLDGSGLNPAKLSQVIVFKHRLFFIEKGTAKLWYGAVDAVRGALKPFNLVYVYPSGGAALALGTMTIDGGAGIDDLLVIFMSSGDAIVYAGTDPTASGDFALVGEFGLGRVIGDRPAIKLGGDLIAITADGYMPLLRFLKTGRTQTRLAVSDAITSAVSADARLHGDETGWQAILYPRANWVLFNVPEGDGSHAHQHVMNTQTGARCHVHEHGRLVLGAVRGPALFRRRGGRGLSGRRRGRRRRRADPRRRADRLSPYRRPRGQALLDAAGVPRKQSHDRRAARRRHRLRGGGEPGRAGFPDRSRHDVGQLPVGAGPCRLARLAGDLGDRDRGLDSHQAGSARPGALLVFDGPDL